MFLCRQITHLYCEETRDDADKARTCRLKPVTDPRYLHMDAFPNLVALILMNNVTSAKTVKDFWKLIQSNKCSYTTPGNPVFPYQALITRLLANTNFNPSVGSEANLNQCVAILAEWQA